MLKTLYQRMMVWAAHKKATYWLMVVSASESIFFPIPPDVMLLPMSLSQPHKAIFYAFVCTVASIVGALVGYAIGFWFFDSIGQNLLGFFDPDDRFSDIKAMMNDQDWWIIFTAAITPIPFKIAVLGAGFLKMNVITFLLAAIAGRSLRYGIIAGLVSLFGHKIRYFIERYFNLVVTAACLAFVGGWLILF